MSGEDSSTSQQPEVVMSPCVGICALDHNDICIGCFRSGQEITEWGKLDNKGKQAILDKVKIRMRDD